MYAPVNWHKWLVLSVLGLALSARPIVADYTSITERFGPEAVARCNQKCPFQNRTGDGHYDLNCGSDCSMQQCKYGCSVWQEGLHSSCQTVCNVSSESTVARDLYCVIGCNEALNTYLQELKKSIGIPSAPALVADSLTATSLSLVWEAPTLRNLSFMLQWRYEELSGTWQYYSNTSHVDRPVIHVDNLRPYTKYRFRVAIFLSGRMSLGEPIYSEPSVVILTLESGRPASPPARLRATAPDSTRVALSWEPGAFPNGPLISYVLRLVDKQPNVYATLETLLQDMPASNNTLFYMFQNLSPARDYEVSVTMRNGVGEGPMAYVLVSTPPLPKAMPSKQPILILGGEHNVLAAPANDMLSDPVELYGTENNIFITGVGLDVYYDYLFVSVSNGYVYRSTLSKKSDSVPILKPENYKPLDLSVDWLNKHLYVLGEVYYAKEVNGQNTTLYPRWEILRCDFDGKNQLVASSGFSTRPIHFEVDAYNGYLFWALRGVERGGLYRLDLANISNGVRHGTPPELILRDAHLGAFTVDHADFRLLVAHHNRNTVLAVSLDGREVTDFRNNTQKPMFELTRSIAYANGLFYWTNGEEMWTEEYHAQSDSYFHNEYPLFYNNEKRATRQVLVALRSCQPIPVPVNPPIGVQSVMGINRAKVSWFPPHLLGHQGTGAWQKWSFHLQLIQADTLFIINRKDINGTNVIVDDLKEDADYIIKVAAVTESGTGPWSSEFVGKTLPLSSNTRETTLIWSGPDGLLQTNLTGDDLQTLIHSDNLKNTLITDISWYRDKLYLVTNTSSVMWYNITTKENGTMENMDNVGSLAVDWVGKKIYWSNPKQQLITRANFNGGNREPVPIVTVAKELLIDSLGAYIYWNTGHAVEAARLNGENKIVYYPAQLFSGKQVMGLTADLEKKWLYWLVRSYDGSELHKAQTADQITQGISRISDSLVTRVSSTSSLGPLCYMSGKLVWVEEGSLAVVSDLKGQYTAELVPRVHTVAVRNPMLHVNSESLIAIPETINVSSIMVTGTWDRFNVTWSPDTRVNVKDARVYYEVSLTFPGQNKIDRLVEAPYVEVLSAAIAPYSSLQVTVLAYTAWGGGGVARASLRSPQAAPAPPSRPRLYLLHNGGNPTAVFRWQSPSQVNGMIRGYEAQCWVLPAPGNNTSGPKSSACADALLSPAHTQLMLRDLLPEATYYFQVRAYTDAGYGPYSDIVSASSNEMNPIPKVIISSQDAIKITDLDSGDTETIPKSTGIPVDFAVSIDENIVYWVNNLEEIFASRINGSGHYKLSTINGSATSIAVDWVSRSVYWSQIEMAPTESHVVYRANLGSFNTRPQAHRVLERKQPIYSLQVHPLTRSLLWYEDTKHPGLGTLMTSSVTGNNVRTFFNHTKGRHRCNCPENPQIARPLVIDMSKRDSDVYWVDPWLHQIIATDMEGCKCRTVVDATEKKKYGFTPMSIAIDSKYVYWFNSTDKSVFFSAKNKKSKIDSVKLSYGYKIMTLDPGNQPYPPRNCLLPKIKNSRSYVISHAANSIKLKLPQVSKPNHCQDYQYEMVVPEYTVFYRQQLGEDSSICDKETCPYVVTTNSELTLIDLKPFTNYSVIVEVTNYYEKLNELKPTTGVAMVIQTAAEAPTAPRNVKSTVFSPVLARVQWTPEPNLWYELHWQSDVQLRGVKAHNMFDVTTGGSANMTNLNPDTVYKVWVRARSNYSVQHADSPPLRLKTYPDPPEITLLNATAYTITVGWTPPTAYNFTRYALEYKDKDAGSKSEWKECVRQNQSDWLANGLHPKTTYWFRLRLQYIAQGPPFYWPLDDKPVYETLGDVPEAVGPVRVDVVGESVVRAWWPEPDGRGAPVLHYRVWGRPLHREINENATRNMSDLPKNLPEDLDDEMKMKILREGLELLHVGTETYWLISMGEEGIGYWVMVQACNRHGWGKLGEQARVWARGAGQPRILLPVAVTALIALLLASAAALRAVYIRRNKKKTVELGQTISTVPTRGPDVELATLRELPIRHSHNILYNQDIVGLTAELASLPHISRENIKLCKFLGSGAFGEVFEGIASNINNNTETTKVAIKTIHKGATEQEKADFLREAALMSKFRHEHVLRLLGVCLDNDPNYIIMELMEGGDLLTYLRDKRTLLNTPESLTLLDLLNICVDVTKGCRYLEEKRFVHRDLACRNCLVAHRANGRVVKIGDFGLARDIYNNDYYRKKGEGMLPVRWMAVECLVDGVFSCQSDVWAWAVLCWEVLSLGQQPYPGHTNREVMAYVRNGGAPGMPPNCPSVFYELLQKCWSRLPDLRPSFEQCLREVMALRDMTSPLISVTLTPAAPPHYLTLLADDEDFPESQMEPSRLLPRAPPPCSMLRREDCISGTRGVIDVPHADGEGYEVPRAPLSYLPFSRHSIVGIAPNRLIKPHIYRTRSLRTNVRPPNATIIPLRNGIVKRASLCESLTDEPVERRPTSSVSYRYNDHKTPF